MIYTKFWYDNYISSLKAKEKLLFIYLITNEKVPICGIYEMPDKYILLDTGLRQKELEKIKQKFMEDGRFAFIGGWIKIMNFNNYNSFTGEKNDIAKEKELSFIPKNILNYTYSIDRGIDRVSGKSDTLNNHNQYINHNKLLINNQEKEVLKDIDTKTIFDFWNSKGIIKHKNLDQATSTKLTAKLKSYSTKEVKQSIHNYSVVIDDSDSYFNYRWTLKDFLQRGFEKFLDKDVVFDNYLNKDKK